MYYLLTRYSLFVKHFFMLLDKNGVVNSWDINLSSPVLKEMFEVPDSSLDSIIRVLNNSYLAITHISDSKKSKFVLQYRFVCFWTESKLPILILLI